MPFLKNVWYFAGWAEEVSPGGKLVRKIAGESVLMWESESGELAAFQDICPHRMVPLSLGKHEGDGIRCAYHGLKFSPHGCIDNPHGPISQGLRPRSYLLERKHGVLWLWMGDAEKADPADIPDFSFITNAPPNAMFKNCLDIAANHQLLCDNILDLSHADFLHPGTLDGGAISAAKTSVREEGEVLVARWDMTEHPALPVLRNMMPAPDTIVNAFLEVRWWPSSVMTLQSNAKPVGHPDHPGVDVMTCHVMTPADEGRTHYFYCLVRDYLVDDAEFNQFMADAIYGAFAGEDQPMAEAQQRVLGERNIMDANPKLFTTDKAAVTARRLFDRALKDEMAQSVSSAIDPKRDLELVK